MKKLTCLIFACAGMLASPCAAAVDVQSPDGNITASFDMAALHGESTRPVYSVSYKGNPRITTSALGLQFADTTLPGEAARIAETARDSRDTTYTVFPGKTAQARDHYNEVKITLQAGAGTSGALELIFRAYNDGLAFRYNVPAQPGLDAFQLTDELTQFRIAGNPRAYNMPVPSFTEPYESFYDPRPVNDLAAGILVGMPLLLQYTDDSCMAITEADLTDYAGLYLVPTTGTAGLLTGALSPLPGHPDLKVRADLPHQSPWRVIMLTDKPGSVIESSLVNNLNPPSVIKDTSWIKPGKTAFPWWNGYAVGDDVDFEPGLNTATMKHYIDFCAENGIPYHSLDGVKNIAWYGGPIRPYEGAPITTTSLTDLDLDEVLRYAKQKDVKLRLWMHNEAAKMHMHEAFPLYEQWGIEGVMIDFFNRDDQETVNFTRELVALAAKHHLTVTLHNCYKPTGLHRTYPNLMTYEAAYNLEYNKWREKPVTPEHDMTVVFARMLAGPVDYHAGGFRHVTAAEFKPRSKAPFVVGTRARELARFVVFEGYLPMLCDYPAAYRNQPGLDALVDIPTTWDETRVLDGAIGEYVVIARRSGDSWHLGAMTNGEPRTMDVSLDFLPEGDHQATFYADPTAADSQPDDLEITERNVTAASKITLKLKPAGGQMVVIR